MASVSKRQWTHKGVTKEAWTVRYFDEKGVRRSKQFDQKKPADAFKRKVEREIEDGTHTAERESMTVADAAEEYLKHCDDRLRDGRIGQTHYLQCEMVFRTRVNPAIGRVLMRDLTIQHVTDLYQAITRGGRSHVTAKKYLQQLQQLEKFARRRGWQKMQPVADAMADLRGAPMVKIKTFTHDEVAMLLRRCSIVPPKHQERPVAAFSIIIHLAAFCGMRLGEIFGLPLDAIDLDRKVLAVRQSVTTMGVIKSPKTAAGVRAIPIPDRLVPILRKWFVEHQAPNKLNLFLSSRGGYPMPQSNFRRAWNDLLKSCGIAPRHFHALRHFHSSWLSHNGMPPTEIAKLLGHAHFDTTLRIYSHSLMDDEMQSQRFNHIAGLLGAPDARLTQQAVSG